MSMSNATETDFLALIFHGTAVADIADDDQTTPATTLTVALHTGDPGEAGIQTGSEATYGSYARQTVARTSGGFTVSGNSATLVANLDFPEASSGSETITHFSIGSGVSDDMMFSGTVTPNIVVTTGVTPRLTTATAVDFD